MQSLTRNNKLANLNFLSLETTLFFYSGFSEFYSFCLAFSLQMTSPDFFGFLVVCCLNVTEDWN